MAVGPDAWWNPLSWENVNPGDVFDIAGKVSNIGPEGSRLRGIAEAAGGFLDTTSSLTSKLNPITGPPRFASWLASPIDPPQALPQFGPTLSEPFGPDGMGFSPGLVQSQIESGMEWDPEQNRWVPALTQDMLSTGVPSPPNIGDASRTAREHQGFAPDWLEQGQIDEQYTQMYDDLRSMAGDEFAAGTAANPELAQLRQQYLDAFTQGGAVSPEMAQLRQQYLEGFTQGAAVDPEMEALRQQYLSGFDTGTVQDPNIMALREQYLTALGGGNGAGGGYGSTLGADLTYFDNRLNRAITYIDAQEQNLLADINELDELKRLGIAGAAERQREMLDELELVRSQRLQTDEAAMVNRAASLEQTRLENEAAIIADISARGQGAVGGHQARMQASQDRLREMGIDPSQITPDETLAMLESQARRNDTYSQRIAGIEAGKTADRDLAIQGMFGGARRSLEDQLFAGRAASGEQEAQMLQSLAEMVMEQMQGVTHGASQGRFGATEEAFGGKYGARKEDAAKQAAAAQDNAARVVAAAAAALGFAQDDAAAVAQAMAAKAAAELGFAQQDAATLSQGTAARTAAELGFAESDLAALLQGTAGRTAAELGFAETDAAASSQASTALNAALGQIDMMEWERNIGGLEEEAAGKVSAQQMNDMAGLLQSITGGAPGAAETVGLAGLTGDTGFIPSFISRQQDMADEDYKRSSAMGVAESLIGQGAFAGHSAHAIASALENGWLSAFPAGSDKLTWTQLMEQTEVTPKDIEDWGTDLAIAIDLMFNKDDLPELFATDLASIGR